MAGNFVPSFNDPNAILFGKLSPEEMIKIITTQTQPEEVAAEPAPGIDLNTFAVELLQKNDPPNSGKAFYNAEANKLTVYMAEGYSNFELDFERLGYYVLKGHNQFNIESIGAVEIDERFMPVCVDFIPTKKQSENGSEIPDKWKFATGFREQSCVCTALENSLKSPGTCPFSPNFKKCGEARFIEANVYATVNDTGGEQLAVIIKDFYPPRKPRYTISIEAVKDRIFESVEEIQTYLNESVGDHTVKVVEVESNKKSYFEKVFS